MYHLLSLVSLLLLTATINHAAVPAQFYWDKVLPNTAMPSAIRDILSPDVLADKKTATTVNVGHGGVGVNVRGKGGIPVNTGKPGGSGNVKGQANTQVGVGKGGVNVKTGPKGKPVTVGVAPGYNPFSYTYAATETQIHDDPNVALFFLQNDLRPGAKFSLQFTKSTSGAGFLPRVKANSIPFSSSKLPEILTHFSVEPNSVEAKAMKQTLQDCEEPAAEGESKYCATSLESMVEFSMLSLGTRDIQAISTAVDKSSIDKQQYVVAKSDVHVMPGSKLVACHAQPYAYAVFYCHATSKTKAYKVPLVGKDGTVVEAVAVCHLDTTKWNPKHLAFQVLKVKPGGMPVCHFLPEDHVVWTSRS